MKDLWKEFLFDWNMYLRKMDNLTAEDVREWVDANPGDRNLALGYAIACNMLDYWDDEVCCNAQGDPECFHRQYRLDYWNTDYASIVQSNPEYFRAVEAYDSWNKLFEELEGRIISVAGSEDENRWQQIRDFMYRNHFYGEWSSWCPEEKMSPFNLEQQQALVQRRNEDRG